MVFSNRKFVQILLFFVFLFAFLFHTSRVQAVSYGPHEYPKLVNYFLKWEFTEKEAKELSSWDVVVLDMEVQYRNPELLKKMRMWNPDIVLLVYITPQEIRADAATSYSFLRRKLVKQVDPKWYLTTSQGKKLSWWPGTFLLNVTNEAPVIHGKRLNQLVPEFVVKELLSSELWDGVYYDNAWDNITYFTKTSDIDLNGDGKVDTNLDQAWREGMKFLYQYTRSLAGNDYIIVGNSDTEVYTGQLNGMMLENFQQKQWAEIMNRYRVFNNSTQNPPFRLNLINANTNNTGQQQNFRLMRYGLASTLLENGYYAFDHGDQDHSQTWWYDEYDTNLGNPTTNAISRAGHETYQPDVWLRHFENGLSLVNSTEKTQTISLGGEYEKIHGTQDPVVNDGSIVSEVSIDGYDGLLLLKTFSTLQDVLFPNGSFVRFFRPDSERVRNGFFVFEDGFKGGDQILRADLDGNGKKELIIATAKNRLLAWRDDGQPLMNVYPYTAMYPGKLVVTVGDFRADGGSELVVAPSVGYDLPIKIYNRFGWQVRADWYPFNKGYTGGYHLAMGQLDKPDFYGKQYGSLIIGAGESIKPVVRVYDSLFTLQHEWLAFEEHFRGGVRVAAGDLDGDGVDELAIGAGKGKKPTIQAYTKKGTPLGAPFVAYETTGYPGIDVRIMDVDYDGRDDIVGVSEGVGL